MRLASFNLLHGRSPEDGLVDLDRLAEAVRGLDADVLAVQEVDRAQPRSLQADLAACAAEAMGAVDWRFAPALVGTPGTTWRRAEDEDHGSAEPAYGVGLMSRLPVREWHVQRLPALGLRSPVTLPGSSRLRLLRDEPRVGIAAVVDAFGGSLTVASTHLSVMPGWNAVQLRRLVHDLGKLPGPHVLLGDLNLPSPLPGLVSRWHSLASLKTYPSWNPTLQLDHALGHGLLPAVTRVESVQMPLSDHRALVIEFAD